MSSSTVSITANTTSATLRKKTCQDPTNSDGIEASLKNDLSHSTKDATEPVLERSKHVATKIKKKSVAKKTGGEVKAKSAWKTAVSVIVKNLGLLVILLILVQMVRKLGFNYGGGVGFEVAGVDYERRIAEVEAFLKTTTKMMQVQVEVVDRKLESEVSGLRSELGKRIGEESGKLNKRVSEVEARVGSLEGVLNGNEWLTREEFDKFVEEFKGRKGGEMGLDEIRAFAKGVVEKEIRKHAADGLGRVDYAVASGGASVVKHSEAYVGASGAGRVTEWLKGGSVRSDSVKVLQPSFGQPGECFPLKGDSGFVEIKLRTAIVPEAITLEHVDKGNVIHCTAKATVAHNFLKLKEGAIYSVKNFVVMQNKEDFRIRKDDTFMLEFNGSTSIRKSLVISKGFVRYPLQLADFDHIKPTENKYLIDAVGYVTNVDRMNYTKTRAKNLDFYLANHRGQSIRVTLWGGLADVLIEKKATHVGMCPVVVTSTSAKQYNNKLYLSSSSSTQFLDSVDIPAIKELNSEICITDASKGASRVDNSEPREGSIENLLMWARNKRNDSAAFIIKAKIDNVRTRKGWNFPSCGGDNYRKGATRKNGIFWCESCSRPVEYPVIRYRLELGISDDTEQTVVVLFDDASVGLIGFPASALVSDEDEGLDDHANLPSPIADLIGTTHMFEIKSHTYYEYGTFESFTCWQVDPHNPSDEPTSASTVDNETVVTCSSSKPPARSPTLTTPSKPVEDRKRKRVVIDDSAIEHELLPVNDVQGDESDIASNNTSSTSSPSFKRLIKTNPANDNKDDSVDIENSDADIELITVDIEQDGDDSTLPVKKKQRR